MSHQTYSIKEASQLTQLSADTIRYYEKIGLLPPVNRNSVGVRVFTGTDITILNFIRHLKSVEMPLEELKNYMDLVAEGDSTNPQRLEILVAERDRLQTKLTDLQEAISILNDKIANYEEVMKPVEKKFFTTKFKKD